MSSGSTRASKATGNLLSRSFFALVAGLNSVGTMWIFALMVLINVDVLSRYLLNAPIQGVSEVVALSIVGIVFLQISDTVQCFGVNSEEDLQVAERMLIEQIRSS